MYTASCLCGGIQLKINTEIPQVFVCHCGQCQKAQGSAFVAIAPIEILQGQALFSEYFATENKKRVFCKVCGSPLFSARLDLPEVIRLRVGIINEPLSAHIASHAFIDYKAAWFEILDEAKKFHEGLN